MTHKLLIFLFSMTILTGCDLSDLADSSSGSGSDNTSSNVELSSDPTDSDEAGEPTNTEDSTASNSSDPSQCAVGTYEFRTDSDNKRHFDAYFAADGTIHYNIQGGPKGSWSLSGNKLTFVGPFGKGYADYEDTWTVTKTRSDCSVLQFQGKSYGQADVTATRI